MAVLRKTWGDTMPLIVLSHHPDAAAQAAAMGALAGEIRRAVGQASSGDPSSHEPG